MKSAIILHGMPSIEEYFDPTSVPQSEKHWLPWLRQKLISQDIQAETPELPDPYAPVYEAWRLVFEQFKIDENTLLVGHSCGAGFLVRWLSENKVRVPKVALVAPFLDPDHDEVPGDFFNFKIDPLLSKRAGSVAIFFSPEDDQEILTSVGQIKSAIKDTELKELPGRGHFTLDDMKTEQFPELLDWLLKR